MAEEELELTEEQQAALALEKQLSERMPKLLTIDDYRTHVIEDPEKLVMVVALASQSIHCPEVEAVLGDLAQPRSATKNAKFARLDVLESAEVAAMLGITQVPTFIFLLKGEEWQRFSGSNVAKMTGAFRNHLIKRNEVMREYDEAKNAKPEAEHEEGEEGEEQEEE